MRHNREVAAKSRERIVAAAARMFMERGVAAVGIAELMKEAGMTHGGFYKHFVSKDALVAEACSFAMDRSTGSLRRAVERARKGEALKAIVDAYLARAHRDNPDRGCALVALGGEIGNAKGAAREALAQGRADLVALIERHWNGPDAKNHAATMAATMMGAMISARVADSKSADDILRAARHALYREIAAR
jgi:TetR/AcrR family transcriptional regulator, transcriptional repressor for nem operon